MDKTVFLCGFALAMGIWNVWSFRQSRGRWFWIGIAMIALRGHDRDVPIPFGPYLALGGWVSLMWGPALTRAYLDWGGP